MALGLAVGAGVALLFRRGPKGKRPVGAVIRAAGAGARQAGRYGARGARWAAERGEALAPGASGYHDEDLDEEIANGDDSPTAPDRGPGPRIRPRPRGRDTT